MTSCTNHPDTMALATCQVCQRPLCAACIKQDGTQVLCAPDYYARTPERVKVESYIGADQPLPPPMPSDVKLAVAPDTELLATPARQEEDLYDGAGVFMKQLGFAGKLGVGCAVFGVWFGIQLINENGRTEQPTSYWALGFLLVVGLIGTISSWITLRQRRTFDTPLVSLLSLSILANLALIIGAFAAFVLFYR